MHSVEPATAAALRQPYEIWFRGLQTGDVELSLSALTTDVVLQPPGGEAYIGRERVRELLTAFHAAFSEQVSWELTIESFSDEAAEVSVIESATLFPRGGGREIHLSGRHRGWLRYESGEWRIARDVSILDEPEPSGSG